MTHFETLLVQLAALKARGVGGEQLEEALGESSIDTLRNLYMESEASRPLARWALTELETEIRELEEVLLAA